MSGAANDPFQEIFESNVLMGLVERFAEPVAGRPFTELFDNAERLNPDGTAASWDEVDFSRGLAPLTDIDSPSQGAKKTKHVSKAAPMVEVKEHVDLDRRLLQFMRNPGSARDNARAQIDRQVKNVVNRIMNTKEYLFTKTCEGSVAYGSFPGVTNLTGTVTWPVQAINAAASWATAGTKIRSSEIPALYRTFTQNGNLRPGRVIAYYAIEGYIAQNTELSNMFSSGDNGLAAQVLMSSFLNEGAVPKLGGIPWFFTNAHYALDATATTEADFLTTDVAIVLPAVAESEYLCLAEGRNLVPAGPVYTGAGGQPPMGELFGQLLTETRGWSAYAEVTTNPIGVRVHVAWHGLPIIKRTNAMAKFDTTP